MKWARAAKEETYEPKFRSEPETKMQVPTTQILEKICSIKYKDVKKKLLKTSMFIQMGALLTTATITFIEAMRTKNNKVRHILNLETCISVFNVRSYARL